MDTLFEVGRTPTPPKPPVNASPRPSAERQDAAHSQDRADAYDRRQPPEERKTRGREERSGEADSRRADASGSTDRKGAAKETEARQPDSSTDADEAGKPENSFSSHMAAKQNQAKKQPADNQSKVIGLTKPPVTTADSISDKIVVKPGPVEAEAAAASLAYPATDHTKVVLVANAVEAKPLAAPPAIVKAEPPKTGDVKTTPAPVMAAPVAARAATAKPTAVATAAADGSRAAGFALPQDLQGGAVPIDGSPLDIDAEIKPQLGERVEVRAAGAAPQKTALPAFNRLLAGDMAPPVIPQGEPMIDAGLGADASPDLAALKQITATGHASSLSAVGAASHAAQAQAPAASQLVAAVKAERVGNGNTIEVRLDPPEMGRVRIDFSLETADAVKAVVTVERSETLEHLRRNVNDLMDQLKQAGFASVDLEFSNQDSSAFEQGDTAALPDLEGDASMQKHDVIYLSLRDDAQMDLLV